MGAAIPSPHSCACKGGKEAAPRAERGARAAGEDDENVDAGPSGRGRDLKDAPGARLPRLQCQSARIAICPIRCGPRQSVMEVEVVECTKLRENPTARPSDFWTCQSATLPGPATASRRCIGGEEGAGADPAHRLGGEVGADHHNKHADVADHLHYALGSRRRHRRHRWHWRTTASVNAPSALPGWRRRRQASALTHGTYPLPPPLPPPPSLQSTQTKPITRRIAAEHLQHCQDTANQKAKACFASYFDCIQVKGCFANQASSNPAEHAGESLRHRDRHCTLRTLGVGAEVKRATLKQNQEGPRAEEQTGIDTQ